MNGLKKLIENMKSISGVLKSEKLECAFRKVDRADFVPSEYKSRAYIDAPLIIGNEQTISQPSVVAFMLELLAPQEGDKVLDLGAGSGWTTALLAELVGKSGMVIGVERISSLIEFGRRNLEKYNYQNAEIKKAGNVLGCPENAPYDKILISASAEDIPSELVSQLKDKGLMVIPMGNSVFKLYKNENGEVSKEEYPGFAFVPLREIE